MNWSPAARSVWGKLDPKGDGWMPLVVHLQDAAGVGGYLWDSFLPEATRRYICESMGIPGDQGRILVMWLAGVHDIGKATPAFAAKACIPKPSLLDVMRDHGMDARQTPEDRQVPHATAGQILLEDWLDRRYPESKPRLRQSLACVVGGHHGTTPSASALRQAGTHPAQLGRGCWQEVRDEILDAVGAETGADNHLSYWLETRAPTPVQVLLTGIVIMADWIASNTDYFPYSGGESTTERLQNAITLLRLPPPWKPELPDNDCTNLLASRFPTLSGQPARPLQKTLVEQARAATRPSLFIVEGPMGVGKTEAALLAAEVLADRFGLGGVFVGLPTMATANPMFERVNGWARTALGEQDISISLVHGKAALNDSYLGLMRQWYGQIYDDDEAEPSVVVNQWLRGRKRSGLADFVVGTIDQSLFAALKAKHVVLRHLGLAGKVVVVDEVHAADDYMREYLKRLLSWLGAYQTPAILMSATLPPEQRDELARAYVEGVAPRSQVEPTSRTDDYPRITVVNDKVSEVLMGDSPNALEVMVSRIEDDLAALVNKLAESLSEGGCAAVICNTVSRAQAAYAAIREAFAGDARLVHSRFIAPDRLRREEELVRLLGPSAEERPQRMVVVGTQVLEQSLDVDFDLMVTDLAPADLLMQRVGRLHRHKREGRPALVSSPSVWIRGVEEWAATPPVAVRGSRAVYGNQRLLRASSVLFELERVELPRDIPRLVRLAYDPQAAPPPGWETTWQGAEDKEYTEQLRAIARAQTFLMCLPHLKRNMTGLLDVVGGDPDKGEEQGRSQVRDSDAGLEVIALWRGADGILRLPESLPRSAGRAVPENHVWGTEEDEKLARAMATCTLRLPASLCYERVIDQVIADLERMVDASGWQSSRWIAGQLFIVFDEFGVTQVAGHELAYDQELGLRVTAKESHQ